LATASTQIIKGSDFIHLRNEQDCSSKVPSTGFKKSIAGISQNTFSRPQLAQNSHKKEFSNFVNPNDFAADIASALHQVCTNKVKPNDKPKEKRSVQNNESKEELTKELPVTTEDDPYMSYVKSISIDLDEVPLDQFRINASFDQCQEAYVRFLSKCTLAKQKEQ